MSVDVITPETSAPWVNATGLETWELQPTVDRLSRELASWVQSTRGSSQPSLFNRRAYVAPDNPYNLMATAKNAVDNDDIVGGTCDVTEGLMFQGMKWESDKPDDADIFNQISRDLNLDDFIRAWHREDYTYNQAVVGMWWGRRSYTVRGKTPAGKKSKRTVSIFCPVALTFLNPSRVVPLKPGPFGQDRLAWHATRDEFANATAVGAGVSDPVLEAFTTGKVTPPKDEMDYLASLGLDPKLLLGLNPELVFRITRTRAPYERWASPRLKSVFPLLDLKQQLLEADRVNLVGSANYLLLVRQGSKEEPANQAELDNLNENFRVVAKLPVIVGDHRLQIDIITPDQDNVLKADKYDVLDARILARALGSMTMPGAGQPNGDAFPVATRGIARHLENRRHMLKRVLEARIARAVVDSPSNDGIFDGEPNMTYVPANVQIDSDAEVARAILTLRTQNELSRESTLEFFGFDQSVEAQRREFEDKSGLDDTFQTMVPYSAAGAPPQVTGGQGGRPSGGGSSPKSAQGQNKPRTAKGNPKT